MKKWEYDISFHSLDDLGIPQAETDFSEEQAISCDMEGHCFFNDVMKVHVDAFRTILNQRGTEGWELLQLAYHKGSLVSFWKRELA